MKNVKIPLAQHSAKEIPKISKKKMKEIGRVVLLESLIVMN
jgi:hypothetical protein